jgi:hypothetical protein
MEIIQSFSQFIPIKRKKSNQMKKKDNFNVIVFGFINIEK